MREQGFREMTPAESARNQHRFDCAAKHHWPFVGVWARLFVKWGVPAQFEPGEVQVRATNQNYSGRARQVPLESPFTVADCFARFPGALRHGPRALVGSFCRT
jgi:hypothetical protein